MSVQTPNMYLVLPTIGVDSGLVWEQAFDSNALTVDQHNHTSGYGVQVPPAGLNINSDLTFNNNSPIALKSAVFTAQSSLATLKSVYVIGNDLYYNDGASNVVRITSGGSVNATSSGISSGSATASFVSSVLVVNSASNTPANIQAGSFLLGNNVASSHFLTLSPPSAMASSFTLVLPNIPASTLPVTLDSSGNFGTGQIATAQIANNAVTAAQIANNTITATQIANNTITATQIANGTVTQTQVSTAFITSGVYTPSASSVSNITIVSIPAAQYFRVGAMVSVSGVMSILNSGTPSFSFRLSIPITAGTFTDVIYAGGSFVPTNQTTTAVDILGGMQTINGTNSVVLITGVSTANGGTFLMSYNFMYQLL